MAKEFDVGKALRDAQTAEFVNIVKEKEAQRAAVQQDLDQAQEKLTEAESELDQIKHEYMQEHITRIGNMVTRVASISGNDNNHDCVTGLLEPLTNSEIQDLIVHSCQMSGEMKRAKELDASTCVSLRLAGLDTALVWTKENRGKAELKRMHMNVREEGKALADRLITNARKGEDKDKEIFDHGQRQNRNRQGKKNIRDRPGRRRLQEVPSDDDYLDDDFPHDSDEDYYDEDESNFDAEDGEKEESEFDNDDNGNTTEPNLEQEIFERLRESLFSQPREALLQRSKEIIDGIKELLKDNKNDQNKVGEAEGEGEEAAAAESETKNPIDPAAYNMVKATLEEREATIERGYDYAISAVALLNSLIEATPDQDQLRKDLLSLAVGTIVHGELSAVHVWEMLQAILPEFHENVAVEKEKTCATSPWVASCPPHAIFREGVSFPPQQVLQAAQALCTTPTFTQEKAQACAADADRELPTVMPNGYYGYDVVEPREENDIFGKLSSEWNAPFDESIQSKLDEMDEKIRTLRDEKKKIEDSIRDIDDLVEGAKESKFGRDGELYALKDQCFSVKAGKYSYEGCVFGNAAQKEGNAKSGTSLGKWNGVEFDEETGQRILKWTGGVKCWNGPQRSATAYVTCGAETKVLLADEPDTCRYVLQMESHIACDDTFKELHEL